MKRQEKVTLSVGIILLLALGALAVVWADSDIGIVSIGNTLLLEYGDNIAVIYLVIFGIGVYTIFLLLVILISKIFSTETEDEEYFRLELKKLRKERTKNDNKAYKKIRILKAERRLELLKD